MRFLCDDQDALFRLRPNWMIRSLFYGRSTSCALPEDRRSPAVPSPQDEGRKAGEVEEIGFKARGPKLRAGSRHSLELDRTEPVGQMHGDHGNQQNRRRRYAGQRYQRT